MYLNTIDGVRGSYQSKPVNGRIYFTALRIAFYDSLVEGTVLKSD